MPVVPLWGLPARLCVSVCVGAPGHGRGAPWGPGGPHVGFPCEEMREGQGGGSEQSEACSSREPMGGAPLGWRSSPILWPQSLAPEGLSRCQDPVGVRQGAVNLLFGSSPDSLDPGGPLNSLPISHRQGVRLAASPSSLERPWSNQTEMGRWRLAQALSTFCGPWATGRCTWLGAASACCGAGAVRGCRGAGAGCRGA